MATHTGCVWSLPTGLDQFAAHGLLGPDIVHVHCNTCTAREWELLRASDAKISTSPETEIQMGMGHPPIRRALDLGLTLSLSCDVMSGNSGDMFSQMRMGLQFARCMDNDVLNADRDDARELSYSVRDALGWATTGGATALGMEDRIGSLTPGKQADVIVVGPGGDRLNMIAPANPVGAVVTQANASNVRTVLVAGQRRQARRRARRRRRAAAARHGREPRARASSSRTLDAGPLLPDPRPSFGDLAGPLLPNFNV